MLGGLDDFTTISMETLKLPMMTVSPRMLSEYDLYKMVRGSYFQGGDVWENQIMDVREKRRHPQPTFYLTIKSDKKYYLHLPKYIFRICDGQSFEPYNQEWWGTGS
jgi:hypothetical protein